MHVAIKSGLLGYCLLGCVAASSMAFASLEQTVNDRLARHPGRTFEQEQALCVGLLDLGPDAVGVLCRMLTREGTDERPRTALQSLAMTVGQGDRQAQRAFFVKAVSDSLRTVSDKEIQVFLIELLQWAGGEESVDVLSGFVTDARLCDPAVRALTTIGTARAAEALAAALARGDAADTAGVLAALGTLRYARAAESIVRYAESDDLSVRQNAHRALANIGYAPAEKSIAAAFTAAAEYPRSMAGSHYLLLARRLAEQGRSIQAAAMCRRLLADGALPVHLHSGALATLVTAAGRDAMDALLAAAVSDDDALAAAAVALADRIDGTQATRQWIALLDDADARLAERLATMLGRRGDRAALAAVVGLMGHPADAVAAAAMAAAVRLDRDAAMAAILEMLGRTDRAERSAAGVDILMQLPGEKVLHAAAESLPTLPAASRIKLMEGLAGRRATGCSHYIVAQVTHADAAVRRAAIRALNFCVAKEHLADVLTLMLAAEDAADRAGLQQAVVAAAMQTPDRQARTALILAHLPEADRDDTLLLLRALGQLGGANALKTVTALIDADDPAVKDAAIRALADWPDASATDGLMEVVKTEALRYQVIALRSMLRLIQHSDLSDHQKVQRARQAMNAVTRNDEKQLVLSFLGQIKTYRSLTQAAHYLDDAALRTAAAIAVAGIALPGEEGQAGLGGVYVATVLTQAVGAITDETLRQRVGGYLESLPPPSIAETKAVPDGFTRLFNGSDLAGWKGVLLPPYDNPIQRSRLTAEQYAVRQAQADDHMRAHWHVNDGVLYFDGEGFSLATAQDYEDFELYVDWKIAPHGDSGIYLRGAPQVQIWDPADRPQGSGGLYNNQKHPSTPLIPADHPVGQWNTFYIKMIDQHVTVYLNDRLVVDNVILENYWDRSQPIFSVGPIELQCHGDPVWFNNIFIRRLPPKENGWVSLFNGRDLSGWIGDTSGYEVVDGAIVCRDGRNLYTEQEYGDFHFKCAFRLTPGANNGIGIRSPRQGDSAYAGMEIQLLDDTAEPYANLRPYQYNGSIYGVVPARRGHLKPPGEWNRKEIIANGSQVTVILNGVVIVDADLTEAIENGTPDGREHPGLSNARGHIVLLGHGSEVAFRDIQIMTR